MQGSGRVGKYRHYLYEWLGVDKVELAVMTELLLHSAQEPRASSAANCADGPDSRFVCSPRTIMDSLKSKGLVQSLTPEGRRPDRESRPLYLPEELERLRRQLSGHSGPPADAHSHSTGQREPTLPSRVSVDARLRTSNQLR